MGKRLRRGRGAEWRRTGGREVLRGGGGGVVAKGGREDRRAGECFWRWRGAVDSYIRTPLRRVEKAFLMRMEDIFSITGGGRVVTGGVERGVVKVGDEVAI